MSVPYETLTIPQVWAKIGGGTRLTLDDFKAQAAAALDNGEDFFITHNDVRYRMTKADIAEFFKTHDRPARKLSAEEELRETKRKYEDAMKEIERLKGQDAKADPKAEIPIEDMHQDMKPEQRVAEPIVEKKDPVKNERAQEIADEVTRIQPKPEDEDNEAL